MSADHSVDHHTPTEKAVSMGDSVVGNLKGKSNPISSLLAHEWGFWTAFAVGVFLLLVLISYNPADPGFFSSGSVEHIHNWGDATGAWLSSFLLFVFGVFAYVVPFGVWMVGSVVFWIKVENQQIDKHQLIKSVGSLLLMLSAGAGMATMYLNSSQWDAPLPYSGGGMLGYWVASVFVSVIDRLATTLALLLLFGLSISWMLGVSWFQIMDSTGELLWNGFYRGRRWLFTEAKPKLLHIWQAIKVRYQLYREGHPVSEVVAGKTNQTVQISGGVVEETTKSNWSASHWQKSLLSFIHWHRQKPEDSIIQRPVGGRYGLDQQSESPASSAPTVETMSKEILVPTESVSSSSTAESIATEKPSIATEQQQNIIPPTADTLVSQVENNTSMPVGVPASVVIDPTVEPIYPIHLSSKPEAWSVPIAPMVVDAPADTSPHVMAVEVVETAHSVSSVPEPEQRPAEIPSQPTTESKEKQVVSSPVLPVIEAEIKPNTPEIPDASLTSIASIIPEADNMAQVTVNNPIPVHHHPSTQSLQASPLPKEAQLPPLSLLDPIPPTKQLLSDEVLQEMGQVLEQSLHEYNIKAEVVGIIPGPVVTLFELQPAPGVRVGSITNLAKDLARSMSVMAVRVVDIIPGKSVIGIEIPNPSADAISFREVLSSEAYRNTEMTLPLVLGKDTKGAAVVADLAKMPHVLVAGQTGSGKSVGVNAMIVSLLYHARPDQVKFIMIDPKMLELSIYQDIPHLLAPVVIDMSEASNALRWCVVEMERRYQLMSKLGVRNIAGFNEKVQEAIDQGKPIVDPLAPMPELNTFDLMPDMPTLEPLPYIVVLIDEFADLFMVVGKKIEELIARLAQKARAAGIHLVLATQRPSVDVVTGLIKANIPARIAFKVAQKVDSRTILDQMGADQLLGRGDMLYLGNGMGSPQRVHGPFVSDDEVHRVVEFLKTQGKPDYQDFDIGGASGSSANSPTLTGLFKDEAGGAERDVFYDEAVAFVLQSKKVSISSVQRKFGVGYNRAARMVEAMEEAGLVSPPLPNGNREILAQNNA